MDLKNKFARDFSPIMRPSDFKSFAPFTIHDWKARNAKRYILYIVAVSKLAQRVSTCTTCFAKVDNTKIVRLPFQAEPNKETARTAKAPLTNHECLANLKP